MKKIVSLLIFFLLLSAFSTSTSAENSASVEVENNVSGNQNISANTEIRIETNGNVTEYKSTEPNQKIEVKAINDTSTIKVDDKLVSETASSEGKMNNDQEESGNLVEKEIKDDSNIFVKFISKIFSFLDFL